VTVAFWVLAPIAVLAALGMVLARKAVHSALLLATVMMSLAVLYAAQDAPFLFTVQIIVYTGAVLMLFLFVLMLVGVDSSDSLVETLRGQRWWAITAALLFGMLIVVALGQLTLAAPSGLAEAAPDGNVPAIAQLLFSKYVFAFEATSALLITAAVGAMVLAHRERLSPKQTQPELAARRMAEYAESGKHPGQAPPPGTFARHNAVDTPALLPDGSSAPGSVSRVLVARGRTHEPGQYAGDVPEIERELGLSDQEADEKQASNGQKKGAEA